MFLIYFRTPAHVDLTYLTLRESNILYHPCASMSTSRVLCHAIALDIVNI